MNIFEHIPVDIPEDAVCVIRPSAVSKFFEYPVNWYKENILKEEPEFKGSTSSVLGSVCHAIYESYVKDLPLTREMIDYDLDKQRFPEEVNIDEVKALYPEVSAAVINEYLRNQPKGAQHATELPVFCSVLPGVYVNGTCDSIVNTTLVDYKHVSTKPSIDAIPWGYKAQLMTYAYALSKMRIIVDEIRIVYGVRPTKTLPARCFWVTEKITHQDMQDIENTLKLIGESVIYCKEHPEATYMIFKSMQFK